MAPCSHRLSGVTLCTGCGADVAHIEPEEVKALLTDRTDALNTLRRVLAVFDVLCGSQGYPTLAVAHSSASDNSCPDNMLHIHLRAHVAKLERETHWTAGEKANHE